MLSVPAPEVVALPALPAAPEALVLGVGAGGGFPTGALDDAAVAAVRALLSRPLEAGVVKDLPRPGSTPRRLLLVGLGDPDATGDAHTAAMRRGGAGVARLSRDVAVLTVQLDAGPDVTAAVVEGLRLGSYRYRGESHGPGSRLTRVEVVGDVDAALERAAVVAEATSWARDVTNTRASTKTPQWFADEARTLLEPLGVQVDVHDESWLTEQGFGGVLAVGGGSVNPPRLIEAHWRPEGVTGAPVLVVGKGITFDTGGYNLKPGASMGTMYTDMAGGAAALAALAIVARSGVRVPVTVLVPTADNAVSGGAYRPGDVVVHHGGRSSEITNTDAEGRLVLADAMAYGVATYSPRTLVDIATLTGAMNQALGGKIAGVIGDDRALVDALVAAGGATGDRLWQLPLATEEYQSELESPVADAVNSTGGPPGAITAALFLHPFAGGTPWAHLDIAGPARSKTDDGPVVKGATGFGARLLAHWLGTL